MASTSKTENLGLNQWEGNDKPKREDFVNDNLLIDQALTAHIHDEELHVSGQYKSKLDEPFVVGYLDGDGDEFYDHTLPITPKMVLVFMIGKPLCQLDIENGYTLCNGGCAYQGESGMTLGIELFDNTLRLLQSEEPSDGIFMNMNALGEQYLYIAFK